MDFFREVEENDRQGPPARLPRNRAGCHARNSMSRAGSYGECRELTVVS